MDIIFSFNLFESNSIMDLLNTRSRLDGYQFCLIQKNLILNILLINSKIEIAYTIPFWLPF